ncbi:MAG: FG-GAP repeat protein [Planctomycetes bacterium]|nr:FG-GAP repeat protein [Planctomycetota bacterium]
MNQSMHRNEALMQSVTKRNRRACLFTAAFLLGAGSHVHQTMASVPPFESMSINILPPMPGGTSTRVSDIIEIGRSQSGFDVWEHAVSGSACDAVGRWMPALWLCNNEVIEGPILLNVNGGQGQANGLAVDPNNPNVVYIGGTAFNGSSEQRAALWTVNLASLATDTNGQATQGVKFQPFQQTFSGGVRVAAGDLNGDGLTDIIVGGTTSSLLVPAVQKVRVWTHLGGSSGFSHVDLPGGNTGGDCGIHSMVLEFQSVLISGFSQTPNGHEQATIWRMRAVEFDLDSNETIWNVERSMLPGGRPSSARTETVENNESITVGGSNTPSIGKTLPAVWSANSSSLGWQLRNLPLPEGANGGRVNGIIAILTGLLVPGDVSGPDGSSAAMWMVDANGEAIGINLNSFPSNHPEFYLNSVSCILPYMEQYPVYKMIGSATGPRGMKLGFVGTLIGSPEYFGQ